MKKSTIYGLLTLLCALLTVGATVYVISTGMEASKLLVLAPMAAALVFSNLMVRAKNERK